MRKTRYKKERAELKKLREQKRMSNNFLKMHGFCKIRDVKITSLLKMNKEEKMIAKCGKYLLGAKLYPVRHIYEYWRRVEGF